MSTPDSTDSLVRTILLVLAVVVLLPLLMMAFAMPMMGMMGWWGGMGPGTGVSPLWGFGSMLVVLAVVLGVGYYLVRSLASTTSEATDPALEELRVAYARGDLSDEEFERRRERLARSEQE